MPRGLTARFSTSSEKTSALTSVAALHAAAGRQDREGGLPDAEAHDAARDRSGCIDQAGDLVLDAFMGSGTTAVAAERLDRRWIGIDCGKLAIYMTQRRLLTLAEGRGRGRKLKAVTPFEVCHAGLYDNALLEGLDFPAFRAFALDLFGCRAAPHDIAGVPMVGTRKGDPVHLFPFDQVDAVLDEGYVESLHERIGGKVNETVYVIVPAAKCDPGLFEDILTFGSTRYFLLRVPYSVIEALHEGEFRPIGQPASAEEVNDALDAYGFDFIALPEADLKIVRVGDEMRIKIKSFRRGSLDPDDFKDLPDAGRGDLAMVLVDPAYDGDAFRLTDHHFGEDLQKAKWQFSLHLKEKDVPLLVFVDIYGNELRSPVVPSTPVRAARRKKAAAP